MGRKNYYGSGSLWSDLIDQPLDVLERDRIGTRLDRSSSRIGPDAQDQLLLQIDLAIPRLIG